MLPADQRMEESHVFTWPNILETWKCALGNTYIRISCKTYLKDQFQNPNLNLLNLNLSDLVIYFISGPQDISMHV